MVLSAVVHAETTNCTVITGASYAIGAPGIYCLNSSISSQIQVNADGVVIDLNGHALEGPGGTGIYAVDRKNLTVRNGTIRGFHTGIRVDGKASHGHLFEQLRVSDNGNAGIYLIGDGSVVRDNLFLNNCGDAGAGARWAIFAAGTGVHVHDNEVVETGVGITPNEVVGIRIGGSGVVVERNVVSNAVVGSPGSRGITVLASGKNTVIGNRVFNMYIGIMNAYGFGGITLFMDNTVGGAVTAFSNGTMAGTTNYSF